MMIPNYLCYYPTTVAIVDDSKAFLAMVDKMLSRKQLRQIYSHPKLALQQINATVKYGRQLENILKNLSIDEINELETKSKTNTLIDIDFKQLYQEAYNIKRFSQISVVLIDYSMPKMSGIEFCRNLKDKTIKKIMITALADYRLAIQAFNEKVIDGFILKNTPNLFAEINLSIAAAQNSYFKNIYGVDGILGFIFRNQLPFDDRNYQEFLALISKKINFVEYYVLDKAGSTLFLSESAKPTWLIIKTDDDLKELYTIAKDNNATQDILMALRNKRAAPVLISDEDYRISAADWKMYPLKAIPSKEGYFYSLITKKAMGLSLKKVVSFKQYMAKNAQRLSKP